MKALIVAACVLVPAVASAQPYCWTVYLPDLAPAEGVEAADIRAGFPVPPGRTQPVGAFYPAIIATYGDGRVLIEQNVGEPWARERRWTGITSVSLVFWMTHFNPAFEGKMTIKGYKTLRNNAPFGFSPTWAFRETQHVTAPVANFPLSTPVAMGEHWNYSIRNDFDYTVWMDGAQIEARICR